MSEIVAAENWIEILDFLDLHRLARARADEIGISRKMLDEITGLTPGYCSKLLAPTPIKFFGPRSLLSVFSNLGLRIVVLKDNEAAAAIQRQIVPRNESNVRHRELVV